MTKKQQNILPTCQHQGFHTFSSALHRRFHQCRESERIPLLNIKARKIVQQIVCNGYVPFEEMKKQRKYVTELKRCLKVKPKITPAGLITGKMSIISKISFPCIFSYSLQSSPLGLSGTDLWPESWDRKLETWVPTFSQVALLSVKSL